MTGTYAKFSVDALYKALDKSIGSTSEQFKEQCKILAELRRRGENHPLMFDGITRWYKEVAEGTLAPLAAIGYANGTIIGKIRKLPIEEQERLVKGGTVTVAYLDKAGSVTTAEKRVIELDARTLDRVFDAEAGRIRKVSEQKKLIKPAPVVAVDGGSSRVRVDAIGGMLVVGNYRIDPRELRAPLLALGYSMTYNRAGKKAA